jgi:peptide/nickel transport system substrate-binding protein
MRRRTFLAGAACGALFPRAGYAQARRTTRGLKFVPQADLAIVDPVVTTAYVTRHHPQFDVNSSRRNGTSGVMPP